MNDDRKWVVHSLHLSTREQKGPGYHYHPNNAFHKPERVYTFHPDPYLPFWSYKGPNWLHRMRIRWHEKRTAKYANWLMNNAQLLPYAMSCDEAFDWLHSEGALVEESYTFPIAESRTITIDLSDLSRAIWEQVHEDRYNLRALNYDVECIIVGGDVFDVLDRVKMVEVQIPQPMSPVHVQQDRPRYLLAGMPIKLIPWFQGVLVVPKA